MRVANLGGRLVLVDGSRALDVATASGGQFDADPQRIYPRWDEFREWFSGVELHGSPYAPGSLRSPVPAPGQVFAIGLNYRAHADETGLARPETVPPVFTKFPACIAGPYDDIAIPSGGHVDWEVELVAVIGRTAWRVAAADAWSHVAGLTVGQDVSERILQMAASPPQFSLGKSYPGFGPLGPVLVTPDEFEDPDDLGLECSIDGEVVQSGRTSQMIFPIGALIEALSAVVELRPGDVVFTARAAGVGMGRVPARYLAAGELLVSSIEGIGTLRNRMVAART